MRKLDAAIAEALGREITWQRKVKTGGRRIKPTYVYYACSADDICAQLFYAGTEVEVPKFHKDGNAMLELDREMQARGFMLMVEVYNEGYSASYWICHAKEWTDDHVSDNMPKAVALAAYKALTGKEWVEND